MEISRRRMRLARFVGIMLCGLIAGGCGQSMGAIAYYFGPRRIQKAEFKPTTGQLAVLIDTANPDEESPVFTQALHGKLVTEFRERKVPSKIVEQKQVAELALSKPDFANWGVQRIGREVGAEQVLWIRVDRLASHESPDSPLLSPSVTLRVRVIGVNEPTDKARLWPDESEGREVQITRPPDEATSMAHVDAEMSKLGRDAAVQVARFFYDYDMEEQVRREC